ncbi:MAG: helix-turn-helix domain-containing protein, partial [Actinomycetota bacterium]|nr:helix-turn-helix domain-containing protein [Actinomycetota bacterium]
MSYGHAETPLWYTRPDAHKALAVRDIGAVYRLLNQDGVSQREIARRTGQVQSEVSEILKGRRVLAYDLLVRIAEGLGVPRELLGLSHGAYGGEVTVAEPPKVSAEMLRRHLIALGGVAMVGAPVTKLGELFELPAPSPVPLPSQLSYVHVAKVRDLTRRLDEVAIMSGSEPEVSTAAAGWAMRLLDVSGASPVKRALMVAVAQLQIQAGWAGFDAGLYDRAVFHYARGLELATKTG